MNEENPYCSPSSDPAPEVDPALLVAIAKRFAQLRERPPTISGMLFNWRSLPKLIIIGIVVMVFLAYVARSGQTAFASHAALGFLGLILGSASRDLGFARRIKKVWPAQSLLTDWNEVDRWAR